MDLKIFGRYITWVMILHGIEYQRPTSLNMRIMADHVTYSFLAFMKSIFHFCLGCYCGGYSQNGRSNLSSSLCFHHRIILKFSGVITNDRCDVHAKGQGQRSRAQRSWPHSAVSGPELQFEFTYGDEMLHKAWCCLEKVPYCFSRSSVKFEVHTAKKNRRFWPKLGVSGL